ncbi:hypothetical protein ABDD95_23555 [Mucilaginibacter sp. PAMB04274]|uniref:hypothetical protein n=1 Tax=Mucilaginibacter sp. PAMB04274 TaxID=3138568 RepID=UPI0031F6B8BB
MLKAVLIIVLTLFFACNIYAQTNTTSIKSKSHNKPTGDFWIDYFAIKHNPYKDSIDGKPVKFYLDHPKVAPIAKNFYKGKYRPSDNDSTSLLLSLCLTNNAEIRPFYRWCLNATIEIADGALSEYPGEPALNYAIKYPKEFFGYMDKDKSGIRYKNWVQIIAYSGLPSYNNITFAKKYIVTRLTANCSNCTISYKHKIQKLATDVSKALN